MPLSVQNAKIKKNKKTTKLKVGLLSEFDVDVGQQNFTWRCSYKLRKCLTTNPHSHSTKISPEIISQNKGNFKFFLCPYQLACKLNGQNTNKGWFIIYKDDQVGENNNRFPLLFKPAQKALFFP